MLNVCKGEPLHLPVFRSPEIGAEAHAGLGGQHRRPHAQRQGLSLIHISRTLPRVASYSRGIRLTRVVLALPVPPRMPTVAPEGMSRSMSSRFQVLSLIHILHLTEEGRCFYQEFIAITEEVHRQAERGFTEDEVKLLQSFLVRVAENLSRETEEKHP